MSWVTIMPPRNVPPQYDAFLLVSFGGPEGPEEVMPFLENVLRGKNVPRERMLEVAEHYSHFGGVSPINEQNRKLLAALETEFAERGVKLPIYWGNRNWGPLLSDTLRQMAGDGVKRAIAFFTSAYSSYSGCRQYRENIADALEETGLQELQVDRLRAFFNHPGFIEPTADGLRLALAQLPDGRRDGAEVLFTAHSIPLSMAENCAYETQLRESCRLVAELAGRERWQLVYQSRSGPPQQLWLEPDICDAIREKHAASKLADVIADVVADVIIVPIGFTSDHLEVLFDLDEEAKQLCDDLGINMQRVATVGTEPRFVSMIRELVEERTIVPPMRRTLGALGPSHDVCPDDCCQYKPKRPEPGRTQ